MKVSFSWLLNTKSINFNADNFLYNDFRKKINIIHWNYIKNTTIHQNFIEIMWPVDYKKDPFCLHNYL